MSEKRVTIVVCYNDEMQFEDFKLGLEKQSEKAELIGINNEGNKFTSCASALNSVADKLETKFVIYSHQDMIFETENALSKIVDYMEKTDVNDIVGVAGVRKGSKSAYTNIVHGIDNRRYAGKNRVETIEEVESVDECFFGGHTEYFVKNSFDEKICDNWHIYAVEQSLRARTLGGRVYVCDADLYHHSDGKHNKILHENFRTLSKAYAGKYDYICAPCCMGYTGFFRRNWGYIERNKRLKVYGKVTCKMIGAVDRVAQKVGFINRMLYGTELFK